MPNFFSVKRELSRRDGRGEGAIGKGSRMNRHWSAAVALVVSVLLFPTLSPGQEKKPAWELGLGVGLLYLPDYRGSNENRFYALPYPYIVYRGDVIEVEEQTISGRIFKTDRVLLDVSYYGSVPVDSDKNSARKGMNDLDATFEAGPALDIRILGDRKAQNRLKIILPLRPVFSTDFSSVRYEGLLTSPRLLFEADDIFPGTGVQLGVFAGPTFADSGYHDYYYTVKPVYATAGRPAYKAGGGYSGSSITIFLSKRYRIFNFNAFVSADILQGAVFEDSPLVKTKNSVMSGISISGAFFRSAKTAGAD
jgi:MipA family protein